MSKDIRFMIDKIRNWRTPINRISEGYDDVSLDHIKNLRKFNEYLSYDDRLIRNGVGYLHFKKDDPEWFIWGEVKAFDLDDGTEVGNVAYGKKRVRDSLKASVDVRPDFRRKGIASQMYDWIEYLNGEKLVPDVPHSLSAAKFWGSRMKRK